MAKRQRLTLQQVLYEIFIDTLSENDEDHLEEDYSDSAEYSPELDEAVPNEETTSRINVSAFIELVVRDFVVRAARPPRWPSG